LFMISYLYQPKTLPSVIRKYLLFAFFCCLCSYAYGQNVQLIRTLGQQLRKAEGKTRYEVLNKLAWEHRWSSPDSTIYYGKQAYQLGQQLKLTKDLAMPLNFMGIATNYKGERLEAYEYFARALSTGTSQHDSLQIAHANNNLGRLFFEQGLLSRSYEYFIKAQAIFEGVNDSSGLAYTYQSLANLYRTQRDYNKAESNYIKAYDIRLKLGVTREIMSALTQLGRLFQEINQHDKALKYLHLADSAARTMNDELAMAGVKTFLADSYLAKGPLNQAESLCAEGLKVIQEHNNIRMLPQAYLTMGQIQFKKGALALARHYFTLALDVVVRTKDLNSKMEAHYWLWQLSQKEHNRSEELSNQNEYLVLKDSIKDLDLARQVERLQFEIEIQRKEQENDLLKVNHEKSEAIISQQRFQNITLIVAIAFVSILGFVQWRYGKKSRETSAKLTRQNQYIESQQQEIITQNEKLSRRNQQLSDLNHEKDTLMSIVAHDLKSPLNAIKGIADVMEMEMEIQGKLTPEQKHYINMTKEATRAGLYLIKDLLDVHMLEENVEPHYSKFDLSSFLLDKMHAFQPAADSKRIHLHISEVQSEEVYLDKDYLSRIIDNLISNAIKFSSQNATVDVSAGRKHDHIWLSIRDEGPGFSEKDKLQLFQKFRKLSARPTAGETSNGLGLAIVKTLVDRMKGTIDLVSNEGSGSEFIIRLPKTE